MKKHIIKIFLALMLCGILIFTINGILGKKSIAVSQTVRTVSYDDSLSLEDSASLEFDNNQIDYKENDDIEIVATKSFDTKLFEELDLVSLDENEDCVDILYNITYDASEEAVLLTVSFEENGEVIIDTIPGLLTYNDAGEGDVLFVVDDETIWLSELEDLSLIDSNGWFKRVFKKATKIATKAVTAAATKVVNALSKIIKPAVRVTTKLTIKLLGVKKSASVGAWFLNMSLDETGKTYHANFDCWQQYFGYTDLYDTVFDAATSMKNGKYQFKCNDEEYILWAWKGDYLNLGAGAELGIYSKWEYSDVIWKVDKSLAMTMTLKLEYKNEVLFDWQPLEKQWWITGFYYEKQNVDRDDLKATYSVTFNNSAMYNSFIDMHKLDCIAYGNSKVTFEL